MIVNIEEIRNEYKEQIANLEKRTIQIMKVILGSFEHYEEDVQCLNGECNHFKVAKGNISIINYVLEKTELHEICKTGLLYVSLMDAERCISDIQQDFQKKLEMII